MKHAILGLAAIVAATPANAADWFILDAQKVVCEATAAMSPAVRSPAAFEHNLREGGHFKSTNVMRDPNGNGKIFAVTVTTNDDLTVMYFPSMANCEHTRATALKNGDLTDPKELR